MQKCGFNLVYEKDKEESNQAIAQCSSSRVITYEGWDGVHHGFDNSTSSRDDYSDFEPTESGLFSADRKQSQSPYISKPLHHHRFQEA